MADLSSDQGVVAAILAGDRAAFAGLVDRHHPTMVRVAGTITGSASIAEEVAQETWLAVLEGLARFEGRSSLRTWLFRILVNRARTRAQRESRNVTFGSFEDEDGPVDADRFDERGYWRAPPERWAITPESVVADRQLVDQVERAIAQLPERQRTVLVMRDVNGWSSEEVRNVLDLSETNQRVLLHRARAKVRSALEPHLASRR
ncbi:MAG: sigma-70 family RNA polymerase sigma factor [Myxococcota bacterium]